MFVLNATFFEAKMIKKILLTFVLIVLFSLNLLADNHKEDHNSDAISGIWELVNPIPTYDDGILAQKVYRGGGLLIF